MTQSAAELTPLVTRAQAGERQALGLLLGAVQDRVMALCVGRLGEPELARDAAQDALIDAFLHIDQLREPRALFGWLRRVALKHCDRQLRRQTPLPIAEPDVAAGAQGRDPHDATATAPDGEQRLRDAQREALARVVIDELPEHERVAVAMHYLAELPLREIAELLEVETNTVKQRLHSARARLRERSERTMTETFARMRPSNTRELEHSVRLFLAVRTGDLEQARSALDASPELVRAEESWDRDDQGLPLGTRATPLVRAAERGHAPLVQLLIERGAEVDGPCGCPTAETPLWAAAVSAKHDCVRLLLEHGADPNRAGASGVAPLHVAAMRDDRTLLELLLAHTTTRVDTTLLDSQGRSALDWARGKGHAEIAARLEPLGSGAQAGANGAPANANAAGRTPAAVIGDALPLEMGIKALDLFAPLQRGMIVRVDGGARVGRNILLAEMSHGLAARPGTRSLWVIWLQQDWQDSELSHLLSETGVDRHVQVVRSGPEDTEARRRELPARALCEARALLAAGAEHVVLTFFEAPGFRADVRALYPELRREGPRLTTLLVTPVNEVGDEPVPIAAPIDARICFDRAMRQALLLPAIDPLNCCGAGLDADDAAIVHEVRAHLRELRQLAPGLVPDLDALPDTLSAGDQASLRVRLARAQRIQAYLTQPFHSTEPFVSRPGVSVPRRAALQKLRAILAGELDDTPLQALLFGDC